MGMFDRAVSAWSGALTRTATGMFAERGTDAMAQGLLAGIFPGGAGYPPARGSRELLRAYATMPWLRAVVHKISDGIAAVQWQVMAVKDPKNPRARRVKALQRANGYRNRSLLLNRYRKSGELVEIDEHPLLDALDASNPVLTGLSNRKLTQIYMDLVGEFFWIKERGQIVNGRTKQKVVTGLWAIPPTWVMMTPTPSRPSFRVGYRGWQREIPSTEVIWGTDPNPMDPYARGVGTAMTLADELETDEYAAKHTRNFFINRARPELIITTDATAGGASSQEFDVLKQRWLNETLGYNRSWKPFFVNRKLDIHELEQNFRNLQLVQLREHERNVIMQTFGIPPEILGVLSSSNRATIEAADLFMARYVLLPRLEFMRAILQERLAPEYDERIIVHYVSPVADDREFKLKAMVAMPATPTVDEWREIQDLEPEEDEKIGAMHILQNTMEPVEQLEEAPPAPVLPPGGGFPPGKPPAGGAAKPKPAPTEAPAETPPKKESNGNGHRVGRWLTLSRQ